MYALNVLIVSPQDVQAIETERRRYRAIYAKDREQAVERIQAIDLDLMFIDRNLPTEDQALLRRLIEIQQPSASLYTLGIETLAGLKAQIDKEVRSLHDLAPKNALVLQETSLL